MTTIKDKSWRLSERIDVGGVYRSWNVATQEHEYCFVHKIDKQIGSVVYKVLGDDEEGFGYMTLENAMMLFERIS